MNEHTSTPTHQQTIQRAWIALAAWMGVIVLESFAGSAENTGRFLWPLLHWFWPGMPFLTFFKIHYYIRKLGHLAGYGVLGLFAYRAWWATFASRRHAASLTWRTMLRHWMLRASAQAVLVVLAIASLDEWHQGLEPGRGSTWHDVLLDCMGALLVLNVLLNFSEWGAWARERARRLPRSAAAEPATESPQ